MLEAAARERREPAVARFGRVRGYRLGVLSPSSFHAGLRWTLLLTLLFVPSVVGCGSAETAGLGPKPSSARFRVGDDRRWADPGYDDSNWDAGPLASAPDARGVIWARVEVEVGAGADSLVSADTPPSIGVEISAAAAREVYWDGVLLGSVGAVGDGPGTERPGPIDAVLAVPPELAVPGSHLVALRCSSFLRPGGASGLLLDVDVAEYAGLVAAPLRGALLPLVFLGGFVLVAMYFGVLYVYERRPAVGGAALLCLSVAVLLVVELWRPLLGYDYDLHGLRLRLVDGATGAVALLLVGTLASQFSHPGRRGLLGGLALIVVLTLIAVPDHELGIGAAYASALLAAGFVTLRAVARGVPGARLACAGVLLCAALLAVTGRDFHDEAFFPAFGLLVGGLLASQGLQAQDARRRFQFARARAARLEGELLKRHLQPHALMNTLTSVIEHVETDPPRGVRALEAVAAELRALAEVSGEDWIPLASELELCRAHLEVTGHRRELRIELETAGLEAAGLDGEVTIPPAVLHTLVENAVSHNAYPDGVVTLRLTARRMQDRRLLVLEAPLAEPRREPRTEGGGLRYVRARLEESAPGAWSLEQGVEGDAWVTRLEIPSGRPACES